MRAADAARCAVAAAAPVPHGQQRNSSSKWLHARPCATTTRPATTTRHAAMTPLMWPRLLLRYMPSSHSEGLLSHHFRHGDSRGSNHIELANASHNHRRHPNQMHTSTKGIMGITTGYGEAMFLRRRPCPGPIFAIMHLDHVPSSALYGLLSLSRRWENLPEVPHKGPP